MRLSDISDKINFGINMLLFSAPRKECDKIITTDIGAMQNTFSLLMECYSKKSLELELNSLDERISSYNTTDEELKLLQDIYPPKKYFHFYYNASPELRQEYKSIYDKLSDFLHQES
jgi:hypothetical protein